jgi:serine/threonine-protein kinase
VASTELKAGDVIDSRYHLGAELGRGAHGVVFRAVDGQTGEAVAIKVLRANISDDPQYAVRLWREAQSLRMMCDASVVHVHRFGHDRDGFVFLVMELLEGETLAAHLDDIESFGDRMSAFEVIRTLDAIARALHAAHQKGIIHRDIKPSNVFRLSAERGGGVRLMDFGLVKIRGAEPLTQIGMIAGSPNYIAPEMWKAGEFDHRADVYSLGAVIYRCLAGRVPFSAADNLQLFVKVLRDERPKLHPLRADLSPEIDDWVASALAIDPGQRFPYVSVMWTELLRIVMHGTGPSALRVRAAYGITGEPSPAAFSQQ